MDIVLKVRKYAQKIKTNEKKVLGELKYIPGGQLSQGELRVIY